MRHRAAGASSAELIVADEAHSAQPGTAAWEGFAPMNTPDVRPLSLPPAPWILIDRTTVEQTSDLLECLAEWLAGADPAATEDCAQACSRTDTDTLGVTAWVGTLAAHIHDRIEEVNSRS